MLQTHRGLLTDAHALGMHLRALRGATTRTTQAYGARETLAEVQLQQADAEARLGRMVADAQVWSLGPWPPSLLGVWWN